MIPFLIVLGYPIYIAIEPVNAGKAHFVRGYGQKVTLAEVLRAR